MSVIIHTPVVRTAAAEVQVVAAVELESDRGGGLRSLWFAFPRRHERRLAASADGFAAALLPLAMRLGEPLELRGSLSPRLAYGLREYVRIQCAWKPDLFREVEVRCPQLRDGRGEATGGAVGLAFSGGVDSFHALMAHLPPREPLPAARVTHCVMINGFDEDADLEDTGRFRSIEKVYEPLMSRLGIELIVVRTNLLEMLGAQVRAQSFASFLTAPALLLGRLFSRFYVAAGCRITTQGLYPDGSHLMLDHLLSTESMQTLTVDAHLTRVEKTAALVTWPETYDLLRVCSGPTGVQAERAAIANCCTCEKCLRTMMTLEVASALDRYGCFPRPLLRRSIRDLDYRWEPSQIFAREIVEFAERNGRTDIARDVRRGIFNSTWFRPRMRRAVRASFRLEQRVPLYRMLATQPKLLAKRLGWGDGWLY